MTTQKFTNFAEATLLADIAIADVAMTISSADAAKMPVLVGSDYYCLTLFDGTQEPEIVAVTAATGGALTITRAQESTVACAWGAGTRARLSPTAAVLQVLANLNSSFGGTSDTSCLIATGTKTFQTQAGLQFSVGQHLILASAANVANYMHLQVTAYSSTTLTGTVLDVGGSGTFDDWVISLSGTRGSTGATGAIGALGPQGNTGAQGVAGTNGVVPIAAAGGTADAITATYTGTVAPTDLTLCAVVIAASNTTATPTFTPNGGTTKTIKKGNAAALVAGDLCIKVTALLEYHDTAGAWILLNPQASTSGMLAAAQNLADVADVAASRTSLGLGTAALAAAEDFLPATTTIGDLGGAASGANNDITSLAAPALGAATATTQALSDSSTKVATTAFAVSKDQNYNAVGSFCFAYSTSAVDPGATAAGSGLRPCSIYGAISTTIPNDNGGIFYKSTALSGTWRCLGATNNASGGTTGYATLWQRIV